MSGAERLRVYHDASCPICRAEIEELARADSDGRLEIIDVSADDFDDPLVREAGLDQATLMSEMTVRDEAGRWHGGPDAFAEIYQRVGLDRMARLWGSRRLRPLVNLGYRLFLVMRPLLVALGAQRIVRWWVRREAAAAAKRTQRCNVDD